MIREAKVSDLAALERLFDQHKEYYIPNGDHILTHGVVDGKDGILAFGLLKNFAEAAIYLDLSANTLSRAKAIKELVDAAIHDAKTLKLEFIHIFAEEPLATILKKHYKFVEINAKCLIREL